MTVNLPILLFVAKNFKISSPVPIQLFFFLSVKMIKENTSSLQSNRKRLQIHKTGSIRYTTHNINDSFGIILKHIHLIKFIAFLQIGSINTLINLVMNVNFFALNPPRNVREHYHFFFNFNDKSFYPRIYLA